LSAREPWEPDDQGVLSPQAASTTPAAAERKKRINKMTYRELEKMIKDTCKKYEDIYTYTDEIGQNK